MPRSVKHGGKKSKKVRHNMKNVVTARKKTAKKQKLLKTQCQQIKEAWDKDKTLVQNITEMGLVTDLNKAVPIKQSFRRGIDQIPMELGSVQEAKKKGSVQKQKAAKSGAVLGSLEKEAKELEDKQSGRKTKLLDRDMEFCIYMIERHGDDYSAMARDSKNLFQETPKQIQKKLRIYKESPYYKALESMEP
ncbi:unnamed protein product, partial [Mesorhabditis belari]|uniref:Nucleolar protein 16 n=1 Tax=Mesorhabditis belari TaxID=2138241 RepID=A0AAF3J606_9BILA